MLDGCKRCFGHTLHWEVPRQEFADITLLVTIDDSFGGGCHPSMRVNVIEFAGLDERCDGCPVFGVTTRLLLQLLWLDAREDFGVSHKVCEEDVPLLL